MNNRHKWKVGATIDATKLVSSIGTNLPINVNSRKSVRPDRLREGGRGYGEAVGDGGAGLLGGGSVARR